MGRGVGGGIPAPLGMEPRKGTKTIQKRLDLVHIFRHEVDMKWLNKHRLEDDRPIHRLPHMDPPLEVCGIKDHRRRENHRLRP